MHDARSEAPILIAEGLLQMHLPHEALQALDALPPEVNLSTRCLLLRLQALVDAKLADQAEEFGHKLTRVLPFSARVWFLLSAAQNQLSRQSAAARSAERAGNLDPSTRQPASQHAIP